MKGFITAFVLSMVAAIELGDDMACDVCGDPTDPEEGCFHNGNVYCGAHLMACAECLSAAAESWREDHPSDVPPVWP